MRKKIVLVILIILTLAAISFYFLLDEKETFQIESVSARLYRIVTKDSLTKCDTLSSDIYSDTTLERYLIGMRIQIDWISVKHEGFSALFSSETDPHGHNDTISKISLLDTAKIEFSNALKPGNIEAFKLPDGVITDHSVNDYFCFTSKPMKDLNDFRDWYNARSWKDPAMTDMFFFSIDKKSLLYFLTHKMRLRFEFIDGRIIESDLY